MKAITLWQATTLVADEHAAHGDQFEEKMTMKLGYEDDIEQLKRPDDGEDQAESDCTNTEFDPDTDSLVAQYFGDVRQYPLLNRAQEVALWERIEALKKCGEPAALEGAKAQMLRANLRLVIYVAKRYHNVDVPLLDLIQEGNIGLMRALEKFEPSRGLKFVTYAHWWVRQAIGRAIIEQRRTVRLPSHVVERKNKLRVAHTKLWQVHKREPTAQELSAELGWTPQEVQVLQDTGQVMIGLHERVSEVGQPLGEAMVDDDSPEPDIVVEQRELQERVADCLGNLSEREAGILRLRYGIDTDHPHTLKEIGDLYGLSRERIRQLETIALAKLRGSKRGAALAEFAEAA